MREVYFTRHGGRVHVMVHAETVNTNIMLFVVVVVVVVVVDDDGVFVVVVVVTVLFLKF